MRNQGRPLPASLPPRLGEAGNWRNPVFAREAMALGLMDARHRKGFLGRAAGHREWTFRDIAGMRTVLVLTGTGLKASERIGELLNLRARS